MSILVDAAPGYAYASPTRTDTIRLVQFVAPDFEAARPVVLAEITSDVRKIAEGASPQFVPGERDRGNIVLDAPYAGEIATLDRHRNAHFTVTLRMMVADPVADVSALVGEIIEAPPRCAIEWRRDGSSVPSYYPLRGDAEWTPAYRLRERRQGAGMTVALNIEVAPYAHHGSMDIAEDFADGALADYLYDQGANTLDAAGELVPSSTAEKRIYHVLRGHRYGDVQGTLRLVTGDTVPTLAQVILSRQNGDDALYAGVQAGALAIVKRDGGATSTLATTAAVLTADTTYWVRGRREGDTLTAELFTAPPTPMGAPAATISHTLAGSDPATFADGGDVGIRWAPGGLDERLTDLTVEAFAYRNRTLPQTIALDGEIPGDLPALCDLTVTPSGGAAAPVAGIFGWARTPAVPTAGVAPLGVIEAETGVLTAFSVAADAGARGGSRIEATATASAYWLVDAGALEPDDEGGIAVEVFARVTSGALPSAAVLWADPAGGSAYGARRYSDYGTAGKPFRETLYRFSRLGRIRLHGVQRLGVTVSANASGWFADYLLIVPARSFIASPMGVAVDSSFPKFAPSTAETVRVLLADGTALIAQPGLAAMAEHGMGRRIELPTGDVSLVGKLSSLAVDRAELDLVAEQVSHTASVQARVLPRFAYA